MATSEFMPMTALDAVNLMLDSISQARVHSLAADDLNPDADAALGVLTETSREIQKRGWGFNTDIGITLAPSEDDQILLPENTLKCKVRPRGDNHDRILVVRGRKLYDPYKHTFEIAESIEADLVVAIEFEDLPMAARWFIAMRAARRFATSKLASPEAFRFTTHDEETAWTEMLSEDAEIDNTTSAEVNPHIRRMRRR